MLSAIQTTADSDLRLRDALLVATKEGNADDAAKLLRRQRHPFARDLLETTYDCDGVPPLHLACKHGHLEVAKLFVSRGAQVAAKDADPKRRGTAIAYAAWGGHLPVIEYLVQNTEATLDEVDIVGNTPLLYAVFGGHQSVVEALVKAGRSLREINAKAHSALLQAACGGHTALVAWLLDQGFNIADADTDGNTALLFAAWGGFLATMQLLLARGAKLAETNTNGHTVLLSAANGGRIDVVNWLLRKGFQLNETNNNGDTCLLLAAYGGHKGLCEWLLDKGVSPKETNNCGFTPLLSAANGGQLDMVRWLIKRGANIDEKDEDGYTPLILAACGGNVKMVEYFLSLGASVTEVNENGDTPLLLAAYCGHSALVDWLLDNGSSLSERNGTGMGALISAANGGNLPVVQLLLNRIATQGASCGDGVEEVDQGGYTPLLLAVQRGYPEVVRLLAIHGANLQATTSRLGNGIKELAHPSVVELVNTIQGMSPIDIAADQGLVDHVHRLVPEATSSTLKNAADVVHAAMVASEKKSTTTNNDPSDSSSNTNAPSGARHIDENMVAIDRLLAMSLQPWAPCRHELFGLKDRRLIWNLVLITDRLTNVDHLPHLPQEIWYVIITFFGRSADPLLAAAAPRGGSAAASGAVAWSAEYATADVANATAPIRSPSRRRGRAAAVNKLVKKIEIELDDATSKGGAAGGAAAAAAAAEQVMAAPLTPPRRRFAPQFVDEDEDATAATLPSTPLRADAHSYKEPESLAVTPSALSLLLTPSLASSETSRSNWRARHLVRNQKMTKCKSDAAAAATRRSSSSSASWVVRGGAGGSGAAGDSTPAGPSTDDEAVELGSEETVINDLRIALARSRQELFP